MLPAFRALLFGTGLAAAVALYPADITPSTVAVSDPAALQPQEIDRRVREITERPSDFENAALYLRALFALMALLSGVIFISGLDDAFVDACYWLGRLARSKRILRGGEAALAELLADPEAPFAIMVPAWKEHEVIAAMVENSVNTLEYDAFHIYCGVYPNDAATRAEVDRVAARYPGRVTRVDVAHPGPTCKADCLNHIVQSVLENEKTSGIRVAGLVLHDCEDVIHPLELKIFNALVKHKDLIQLPVFSLPRKWSDFTAATYLDDFAESHGKDMAVREALVGLVPGAGVGTCYSRRCLAALWACSAGEPFNTASLTEDYDLSFRLKALRMAQTFAHVTVDATEFRAQSVSGPTGAIASTHEYFPDRIKAAYRQRARWIIGIAFQGWQHLGWRGSMLERYFLFRDRKALVTAPATALAYLVLANLAWIMLFGSAELNAGLDAMLATPALASILALNVLFMLNRAAQRVYFVGELYGARQGLLALARMPVNNLVNFLAVMRAWRLFLSHLVTGKKLAWDKTAHVYPDLARVQCEAPAMASAGISTTLKTLGIVALCGVMLMATAPSALADPPELTGPAYELADRAYKALERDDADAALRLSTQALRFAPGHPSLLLLQADALSRQQKNAEAAERVRGLSAEQLGGWGLAQRGYLWLKTGDNARAESDFTQALELGGLTADSRANIAAELGYIALARNDDAAALRWFRNALEAPAPGMSTANLAADAGYAAMRLGQDRVAVELFSRAIDETNAAPQGQKPFDPNTLYGLRRTVDTLSRRWSALFSVGHSTTGVAATGLLPPGKDLRVVQAGAEIYYTPERFGYRDGRTFQWYANAFQALSANDPTYATGGDSLIASFGARYKPLREQNLVFGFERRFALGAQAGEDEWLARIAYSASRQLDWNPTRDTWTTWQVYTESAYFFHSARLIQPFDLRIGQSWKVKGWGNTVATPFIGVAGEYDRAQNPSLAAGVGPGVALRYWFGEAPHRAFPRYLDFSLQYRWRLTDAERGGGLFALMTLSF